MLTLLILAKIRAQAAPMKPKKRELGSFCPSPAVKKSIPSVG